MRSEINDEVTIAEGGDGIELAMNQAGDPLDVWFISNPTLQGCRRKISRDSQTHSFSVRL